MVHNIFRKDEKCCVQKWDYCKFKIREIAIRFSKDIEKARIAKEKETMEYLRPLLNKYLPEKKLKLMQLQNEINNVITLFDPGQDGQKMAKKKQVAIFCFGKAQF